MTGQHVWVLTDESNAGELGDTLSCYGVFTSRERALAYFRRWVVGRETADRIVWTAEQTPTMWEGYDPQGKFAFTITSFELDGEE